MPAATGAEKWKKYFQGKGNVKTTIKRNTKAVEFKDPTIKIELKEGTEIVVYSKSSYEQYEKKYLISLIDSKKQLLISGDDVEKPITGDCENIKPQHFGMKGSNPITENYTVTQMAKMVKETLAGDNRSDLHPVVKKYLLFLMDAVKSNSKTAKFKEFATIKKNEKYLKEIGKNFGEILSGVIVVTNRDLFPKLSIKDTDTIFFPKEENYPLADFLLIGTVNGKKKVKYYFSVKAEVGKSKSTNTVKPEDVMKLFDSNPHTKKKWAGTLEYKIIRILADNGVITGPLRAALELCKSKTLAPKGKVLTPENITKALKSYEKAKKLDAKSKAVFQASYLHVSASSKQMDYTNFFLDAINSQIYYIILAGFTDTGIPKWETIGDTTGKNQKELRTIYLRYKDDQNRMGFQT